MPPKNLISFDLIEFNWKYNLIFNNIVGLIITKPPWCTHIDWIFFNNTKNMTRCCRLGYFNVTNRTSKQPSRSNLSQFTILVPTPSLSTHHTK
jgi:hypothetical protein